MIIKLILGRGYKYLNSVAVPTGLAICRGERAYWVHIMGPDFKEKNGVFGLYSESGKYAGSDKRMIDIDPSDPYIKKAELVEEDFVCEEEPFTL